MYQYRRTATVTSAANHLRRLAKDLKKELLPPQDKTYGDWDMFDWLGDTVEKIDDTKQYIQKGYDEVEIPLGVDKDLDKAKKYLDKARKEVNDIVKSIEE